MRTGTIIDYSLRLYGLALRWKTLIEVFEPESRFVDELIDAQPVD